MATETSMVKSVTLSKHNEKQAVFMTMLNSSGAALVQGQEVYLSGNNAVTKRSTGAQLPVGDVTVGGNDGEYVTVHTIFRKTLLAHAKGGTLAAGAFVKPNGTFDADGTPQYVAAAPVLNDYASAVVIIGGAVDTQITLGLLRTPISVGAVS